MSLTNIEYGSLASSSVMNNNFQYLDGKISDTAESTATSISTVSSNIATINSRLSELSEDLQESIEDLETAQNTVSNNIKLGVNSVSMLPNWAGCSALTSLTNYEAPSNGYIIIVPKTYASGNIVINNVTLVLKQRAGADDNSSQWITVPIAEDDIVTCTCEFDYAYFLPACDANFNN